MKKLLNISICLFMSLSVFANASTLQKAEQGEIDSQYQLGEMYYSGAGVAQDYKAAAKWYQKAAQQGDSKAQFKLAEMYYNGTGVAQHYKAAAKWYLKAAQQGDPRAQFKLGLIYSSGEGVIQDIKLAYMWAKLSEYNGYHNARKVKNILLMRTA
ncbi:MAG: TPR repeat protein [Psychromonas sp.]|jgi:TPR repeat protein